jgi:lysophospholipase L1-like esterase
MTSYQGGLSFDNTGALRVTTAGQAGMYANGGLTLALAGDSITAGCNATQMIAIANCSGSGTTGTITGVTLDLIVGNTVWLSGFVQSEWNGQKTIVTYSGGVLTFTNSTTLTSSPTAVNASSGNTIQVLNEANINNRSFISTANGFLGLPFSAVYNRATSGTTSTTMLANFDRDIVSLNTDWVSIMIGTNDIGGLGSFPDSSVAAAIPVLISNIQAACAKAIANGSSVILHTILPQTAAGGAATGTANNTGSAVRQAAVLNINNQIRKYAASTRGIVLCDSHAATSNPLNGYWKAGSSAWTADGIHPTSKAAFVGIGQQLKTSLNNAALNRIWPLVENAGDCYASDNTNLQLMPDPLFQTTTTAAATGFTGSGGVGNPTYLTGNTVPVRDAGTPTASVYMSARADGFGNNQRCDITATAANDQIAFEMQNSGNLNAQIAAYMGRKVKFTMAMKATNVPSGSLSGINVYFNNPSGGALWYSANTSSQVPYFDIASGNYEWIVEGSPWVIPTVSFFKSFKKSFQ